MTVFLPLLILCPPFPLHSLWKITKSFQKSIQCHQGFSPLAFQFTTGNGVFIPDVFHHRDEPPFFGIEVAVELVGRQIVNLFQDEVSEG
jgi:hypothetical protein